MNKNIKYSKNSFFTSMGILWLVIALLNLVSVVLLSLQGFNLVILMPLLNCFLSMILGVYYFKLPGRNYLIVNDQSISLDKGLMRSLKMIKLTDIRQTLMVGNHLRIELHTGKEERVNLSFLSLQDIQTLNEFLTERVRAIPQM